MKATSTAATDERRPDASFVKPGDLEWVRSSYLYTDVDPSYGPTSGNLWWLETVPRSCPQSAAFEGPLLKPGGFGIERGRLGAIPSPDTQLSQSADEWLNSMALEASKSLSENQPHLEQDKQPVISEHPGAARVAAASHELNPAQSAVYSGPLSWVASPSAITAFLGQSELRQSVNMIQQVATAETVLRAEMRHEVQRLRDELDMERNNSLMKEEELKRMQANILELKERLVHSQRKLQEIKEESSMQDYKFASTLEILKIKDAEDHARSTSMAAQLEVDSLFLKNRLDESTMEKSMWNEQSVILQARLEEEMRKTTVENASLNARLLQVEQQCTLAVQNSSKRTLREADSQTLGGMSSSTDSVWGIEPRRMERYIKSFQKADVDGDGFVSGTEARVILDNTGLPQMDLSHIWNLADMDMDGRLDFKEFVIALHLAFKRLKERVPLPPSLPLALLKEVEATSLPRTAKLQEQSSGPSLEEEVERTTDAFAAGFAAATAQQVPPPQPVPQIVVLQQPSQPGFPMPATSPQPPMQQPPMQQPPLQQPPMQQAPMQPTPIQQMSMQPPPMQQPVMPASVSNQQTEMKPPAPASVELSSASLSSITAESLMQYRLVFQELDVQRVGRIGADEAKDFFEQSGLPVSELAQIWQVSDLDQDGLLSVEEFQLAMTIVVNRRSNAIHSIPDQLPLAYLQRMEDVMESMRQDGASE
mmetsp:Transcript_54422/g.127029  ORF Transcript_54422/g.127029 Transcript_54422/m.127029 type:complete len:707 (-) Transcript_54422:55-2175(-)